MTSAVLICSFRALRVITLQTLLIGRPFLPIDTSWLRANHDRRSSIWRKSSLKYSEPFIVSKFLGGGIFFLNVTSLGNGVKWRIQNLFQTFVSLGPLNSLETSALRLLFVFDDSRSVTALSLLKKRKRRISTKEVYNFNSSLYPHIPVPFPNPFDRPFLFIEGGGLNLLWVHWCIIDVNLVYEWSQGNNKSCYWIVWIFELK